MDNPPLVYDSLINGAIRMARRRWYLILIVGLLALAAGFVLNSGSSSYVVQGRAAITLDYVASPAARTEPTGPTIDPLALALRVTNMVEDEALTKTVGITVTGDATAGSLTITAAANSREEAERAYRQVADLAKSTAVNEASQSVKTRVSALASLAKAQDERIANIDAQIAKEATGGGDTGPNSSLGIQRSGAANEAASTKTDLALAQSQLDTLATGLVTISEPTAESDEPSVLFPVALFVAGAVVAFGAIIVIQAVDGRIRRRIQVERDVPHVSTLGVMPKTNPMTQLKMLDRSLARFVDETHPQRVVIVDLKGTTGAELASHLTDSIDVEVSHIDSVEAAGLYGNDSVAVVFAVPFGAVTQEVLQAAVADARTAGSTKLGVILTNVPALDHAWAAVSID